MWGSAIAATEDPRAAEARYLPVMVIDRIVEVLPGPVGKDDQSRLFSGDQLSDIFLVQDMVAPAGIGRQFLGDVGFPKTHPHETGPTRQERVPLPP